jgi:uncharacterized membrane protein YgcG
MLGAGMGALAPDALVIPLPPAPSSPTSAVPGAPEPGVPAASIRANLEMEMVVHETIALGRNCLVAANFGSARAAECWGAKSHGLQLMARQAAEALSGGGGGGTGGGGGGGGSGGGSGSSSGNGASSIGAVPGTIDIWLIGALPVASADAHDDAHERVLRRLGLAAQLGHLAAQAAARRYRQLAYRAADGNKDDPQLTRRARRIGQRVPKLRLLQLVPGTARAPGTALARAGDDRTSEGGAVVSVTRPLNSAVGGAGAGAGGDGGDGGGDGGGSGGGGEWAAMRSDVTFLAKWLRSVRIDAEVMAVPMPPLMTSDDL